MRDFACSRKSRILRARSAPSACLIFPAPIAPSESNLAFPFLHPFLFLLTKFVSRGIIKVVVRRLSPDGRRPFCRFPIIYNGNPADISGGCPRPNVKGESFMQALSGCCFGCSFSISRNFLIVKILSRNFLSLYICTIFKGIFMCNAQTLINNIKNRAKQRNVIIRDMLNECGLSINAISQITDKKGISSFSLARIADYLDCSVDYLLGRTDKPEVNR